MQLILERMTYRLYCPGPSPVVDDELYFYARCRYVLDALRSTSSFESDRSTSLRYTGELSDQDLSIMGKRIHLLISVPLLFLNRGLKVNSYHEQSRSVIGSVETPASRWLALSFDW